MNITKAFKKFLKSRDYTEWKKGRPKQIQELIRQFPPDKLYRIRGEQCPAMIYSYVEKSCCSAVAFTCVTNCPYPHRTDEILPDDLEIYPESENEYNKDFESLLLLKSITEQQETFNIKN